MIRSGRSGDRTLRAMSVAVDLDDLQAKTAEYRWAYLLTVRDDPRPHVVAVSPAWVDGALVMSVGRGSAPQRRGAILDHAVLSAGRFVGLQPDRRRRRPRSTTTSSR